MVLWFQTFLCFLFLGCVTSSQEISLEQEVEYINQQGDYKCRMRIPTKLNRMVLECDEITEDAFLTGNFHNNSHAWYFCSLPVMTVVLKDENNLTFCFRQEDQYPIPFVCNPVDMLPRDTSCETIFEYHKNLYTPTFTTQTSFIPTTTTITPISSTLTEKVTTEKKDHKADQWKIPTFAKFAIDIFAFVFAMLLGAALCYIVLSIKTKFTTMNEYGKTPKASERKFLTGTSRETEV